MTNRYQKIPTGLAAAALLVIGLWGLLDQSAEAGPITGTPTSPATKLAVYQGVISLYPGTGVSLMEIGNRGQEINGTQTLYLRPQRLTALNGLQVVRDNATNKANLRVVGRLCLAGSCRNAWPGSSGTTFWQAAGTQITPATATHGVYTPGAGWSPGALQIYGQNPDTALYIRNTNLTANAYALDLEGGAFIHGDLEVNGQVNVEKTVWNGVAWVPESGRVWHAGNDGATSGLDADLLDGYQTFFDIYPGSGNACSNIATSGTWCICADLTDINGFPVERCIDLR